MRFDFSKLSKREANLLQLLQSVDGGGSISSDDIVAMIFATEGKKVKRQNAIVCVKYLQAKLAEQGGIINRTSTIGAGQKATYSLACIGKDCEND